MVRTWICFATLLLLMGAQAQGDLPLVRLNTLSATTEEDLIVDAEGLESDGAYTLLLTGPGEAIEEEVVADEEGRLSATLRAPEPGDWTLEVAGPGVNALRFRVLVTAAAPEEDAAEVDAEAEAPPPGLSPPVGEEAEGGDEGQAQEPVAAPDEPGDEEAPELPAQEEEGDAAEEADMDEPEAAEPVQEGDGEDGADDAEPEAEEDAPSPAAEAPTPDSFTLDEGAVLAQAEGETVWQLEFPAGSGETLDLLEQDELLYVAHGNSLLAVGPETGQVQDRWLLPGQITVLQAEAGVLTLRTTAGEGTSETFTLVEGRLQETVRFGLEPGPYAWLRREAEVADPEARLEQDPTNPWLHFAVGESLSGAAARRHFERAVAAAETFYDLAGLARELAVLEQFELANEAMDAALSDFAARGYDPRLLRSEAVHALYNFPLEPFEQALAAGDLDTAAFWAPWLQYFAVPEAPGVRAALQDYADALLAADRRDDAARVRDELAANRESDVVGTLEQAALRLGRSGWFVLAALLLAFVALHGILIAKYWPAQQINLERRRRLNRSVRPLSGLLIMRYYSFTEKLVLVLLLATALLLAALAAWYARSAPAAAGFQTQALSAGSLALPEAQSALEATELRGVRGDFVRGYATQVAGDEQLARGAYQAAGRYAPAINNLGVLEEDESRYREALELAPELAAARYNLGETQAGFRFQQRYLPGQPVLAVPSERDLQIARAGSWDVAVTDMFSNPWTGLMDARPSGLSPWLWTALLLLFMLIALVSVVWLLIPRMRWVAKAPRSWLYHLLAVLVPGSGLADEMWGLFLIVPWAVAGLAVLAGEFGWFFGSTLGLNGYWASIVLIVVYLINLVAVVVEYLSYRRRMQVLKRDNPALAEEFGLLRR